MMSIDRLAAFHATAAATCLLSSMACAPAYADVTVQEQSTFDFSIVKAHGNDTEMTTSDKQRHDNALHCDGFMSMLCGNVQSGQIIRLDRDLQWELEPKKKEYRERPFLTPAERQALQQKFDEQIKKMQQCPAVAQQNAAPAPDTSKCKLSPPKFDVTQTDSHSTLAGHDAQLTRITMTESCVNAETGDTCDFQLGMDAWLTQEAIAGLDDRRAFQKAYLHKMGLDDPDSAVQRQLQQFLAPYAASLKQLAGKAGALKGYPLKSAVRIAFGGPHCAASQQAATANGGSDAAASQPSNGISTSSLSAAASSLGGKLVGGLFAKKKADADAAAAASSNAAPLPPGMIQAAQFTTETTSISDSPIAASQFEIPAGWKLIPPPPPAKEKDFSCPKSGA